MLTGDSRFVNSVGGPDLPGSSETDELTQKLFETLREFYRAKNRAPLPARKDSAGE